MDGVQSKGLIPDCDFWMSSGLVGSVPSDYGDVVGDSRCAFYEDAIWIADPGICRELMSAFIRDEAN